MTPTVTVDSSLLKAERLPCHWCGGEIDYAAEPGSARSFTVQDNQATHYSCAAAHAPQVRGRGGHR